MASSGGIYSVAFPTPLVHVSAVSVHDNVCGAPPSPTRCCSSNTTATPCCDCIFDCRRRLPKDVLPFKQFVVRGRVLGLYRQFFRETVGIEPGHAIELRRCDPALEMSTHTCVCVPTGSNGGVCVCVRACARSEIRTSFRRHAAETDAAYIKTLLVQGRRQLDQLRSLLSSQRRTTPSQAPITWVPGCARGAGPL